MSSKTVLCFIHAITPLHVGTGRGVGFIDLPVMREKVTGWPIVPGSSIKGVLADYHNATEDQRAGDDEKRAAFGMADSGSIVSGMPNAGSLVFTDARLVCLPVRSLYGTFAWVTSPLALKKFMRDLGAAGKANGKIIPDLSGNEQSVIRTSDSLLHKNNNIFLEDNLFTCQQEQTTIADQWADELSRLIYGTEDQWADEFKKRFLIVPDEAFDFFCELGTEVRARIKIQEQTKTVQEGALWYEEALPAETIMAGLVWCDKVYGTPPVSDADQLIKKFCSGTINLQLGGNATIGKGLVNIVFCNGGES